ncbi:hypothetical protein SAMN04487974_105118 [Pelagibacterium luteolum]|uniref:Cell pole-organizing protein PopZ n=2 Tax=Pelagibacterium luteolum TaxID=440168 RepID=A0A1G7W006_9HYPH|nr:hypothetical protein SAMN04487974_105118 [Pelagibacterium luteolum]
MMNQPASKEPTMDEILSSIRQIIADDDEAAAQKMPAPRAVAPRPVEAVPAAPRPVPQAEATGTLPEIDPFSDEDEDEIVPLALSPEQIVEEEAEVTQEAEDDLSALLDAPADLVVPDDAAFEQDREDEPTPVMAAPQPAPTPVAAREVPKERPSFAQAAPMPDPDLSRDLAEELLEPATSAAVRSAMSKLNTPKLTADLALGANGLTIEAMIREMLRPMLKDWLDENLPSMVERIVAQEIERVSRGG